MSDLSSSIDSRTEARRKRREQRIENRRRSDPSLAVTELSQPLTDNVANTCSDRGGKSDIITRSRSSTDPEGGLLKAVTSEEKSERRRQRERQKGGMAGENKGPRVPVVSDITTLDLRERDPESELDLPAVNGVEQEADFSRSDRGHHHDPASKRGGYENYTKALRKGKTGSDVDKRKQKLAARADGHYSDEDEVDAGSEHLKVDKVTGEVQSTAPVRRIKENYLASAAGTAAKAPRTVHIDKPNNVKKQWPPSRPTPEDDEDEEPAPRHRQTVVKTFEYHDEEDKGGVDEEHVQSVHSLKSQWSTRPFDKNRPAPGVNKPHVGIKKDAAWIKHFRPVIDEGDAPKEPEWMRTVRQRRWLSTVRARFPQTEEEARAFAYRSTTPQKPCQQNPFTIMRSKSDLDYDEFQETMRRRRQKTDDLSYENMRSGSTSRVRRSMSSFSEGDKDRDSVDTFLVLNKVPVKGPIKEYKKNVQMERARTTMLGWSFSTDQLEDPTRFDLPTPVDLQTMDDEDREMGIFSVSSSSTSSAVFPDEDIPDASSTPYLRRHSGSDSSDDVGRPYRKRVKDLKKSLSESSQGDIAKANVEDLEIVPKVKNVKQRLCSSGDKPVHRTTPEEEIKAISKARESREQMASADTTDGPRKIPEDDLSVCPKMKDVKERLTKPRDFVSSKGVKFDEDESVPKISDIKNQFSAQQQEKLKHTGKPNIDAKKIYKGSDFESVMAHRKLATDDNEEGTGRAAEEIKNLASDIAKTFGTKEKNKDLDQYAEGIKDEDVHSDGGGHGLYLFHKDGKLKKPIIERQLQRKTAKRQIDQEKLKYQSDIETVRQWEPVSATLEDSESSENDADVDNGGSQKADKEEKNCGDDSDQSEDESDDEETESEKEQKEDEGDDKSDSDGGDGSDDERKNKKNSDKGDTEEEDDDEDEDDDDDDGKKDDDQEVGKKPNVEIHQDKTPVKIKVTEIKNKEESRIKVKEIYEKEETKINIHVKTDENIKIKVEEIKENKDVALEIKNTDDKGSDKVLQSPEKAKTKLDEISTCDENESSGSESESDIEESDDEGEGDFDDEEDGNELSVPSSGRPLSTSFEVLKKVRRPIQDERPSSFSFKETEESEPIMDNYRSFAADRRRIMPARRHAAKRNPVKERLTRDDLRTETDYLVIKGETNKVKEVKGLNKPVLVGKRRQEQSFTTEALAGLSSKENLANRTSALRKTAKDKSGISTEIKAHSGFLPVMLLQIKGHRNLQVRLVEPSSKSLNSGDVFVLVLPKEVHVWNGKDSTILKKAKGTEVSTIVVKQKDLGCNAKKSHVIEQNKEMIDAPTKSFWKALGGKPNKITDGKSLPTNEEHEKGLTATNLVYRVNCSRDPPELLRRKDMCGKILSEKFLDDAQAYVLDFGTEVYLWLGRNCPKAARVHGTGLAQEIFKDNFKYTSVISPLDPTKKAKVALKPVEVERPKWALFGRMTQRSETVLFRSKFTDWPDHNIDYTKDFVKRPLSGSFVTLKTNVEESEEEEEEGKTRERPKSIFELKPVEIPAIVKDTSELSLLLESFDIGRGTGSTDEEGKRFVVSTNSIKIWHVKEHSYTVLPEADYGHFHSSEGYVVRWKYCVKRTGVRSLKGKQSTYEDVGRDKVAYFFWQGRNSTVNEKGTAALMTVELNSDKGPQVLVSQGKEPPCFPRLFNGKMVTHTGKRDDDQEGVEMFIVHNEEPEEVCLIQIPTSSQALRSRTSFIVLDKKKAVIYTWHGCKSSEITKKSALNSAKHLKSWYKHKLSKSVEVKEVNEGEEGFRDFWKAMGGKSNYCSLLKDSKPYDFTIRVFQLNSSSGNFEATEVLNPARSQAVCPFPILQQHLYNAMQPALYFVDAKHELYLWQGWWPVDEEEGETRASTTGSAATRFSNDRRLAMETIKSYAEALKRDLTQAYIVFAGLEPPMFKNLFPFWEDREDVAKLNKEEGRKDGETLKLVEQLAKISRNTYSLEELRKRPLPEGVDPTRLEAYLSPTDFEKAFGMSKNKFDSLPQWKKPSLKKEAGLF